MAKPVAADRFLTKRNAYGSAALIYYVRPAGNDSNNGLTPATAFATLERGLSMMAIADLNVPVVIDITGMTITGSSVLNLGGTTLGSISSDIDLSATSPNNFYSRRSRQIRSELAFIRDLNVTASAFDPISGLLQLTVSDALVANALRGQFAIGATLGEYGTIRSNTGGAGPNTVNVANAVGLTLPVRVYTTGATITFGDAANPFEQAIYVNALSDWSFQGIRITSNGPKAAAITVWPNAPVTFLLCDIAGMDINEGSGIVTIDGCQVRDRVFSQSGAVRALQSLFYGLSFLCHGSGSSGLNEWIAVYIDASSAFGGGNVESRYSYQLSQFGIDGGTDVGAQIIFGVSRIEDGIISNCAGSAISVENTATAVLDNVHGTGNVGYGVAARYGAMVKILNPSTVTGTINDLFVGTLGAQAWAAIPITDAGATGELVRIGA